MLDWNEKFQDTKCNRDNISYHKSRHNVFVLIIFLCFCPPRNPCRSEQELGTEQLRTCPWAGRAEALGRGPSSDGT